MKRISISDLKARLSEHLREVRRGHPLTIFDRSTPVARIVPIEQPAGGLTIRRPAPDAPHLRDLELPAPVELDVDVVDVLLEERQADR